jgi:probable rRNA maturation factor
MSARPYRIQIQISVRQPSESALRRLKRVLAGAVRAALQHHQARPGSISVRVVGDAAIRRLNSDFLGHDYATDVLSFPTDGAPAGEGRYYGDLALSLARARAQAKAGGHPLDDELRLLAVHGTLHLLGFDHDTPARQRRMWRAQSEVLTALGAEITSPKDVHVAS